MYYKYIVLLSLTTSAVVLQGFTIYTLVLIERTKILGKTIAWKLIGIAFLVFLIKWIFGAWLIYTYHVADNYTIIYESFTFVSAALLLIGFRIVLSNLKKTMKFLKWFTRDTPRDLPMKVIEKTK